MSAVPGSFRSLVDNSISQGQGVQRQHIGAKILWILMMICAPFLCPVYLLVAIFWVCLVSGKMTAETKATIFVMMIFFGISWIPLASLIVYLETKDPNDATDDAQIKMVNGLTPIAAYYMFTIWGIVVAFRRFKLTDAYEIETSRRDVACLRDIIIEPKPIPIPGAREMVKAMKASQAAKRDGFGTKGGGGHNKRRGGGGDMNQVTATTSNNYVSSNYPTSPPVPWYKRIFGGGNSHDSMTSLQVTVPGLMGKDDDDAGSIIGDPLLSESEGHGGGNAGSLRVGAVSSVLSHNPNAAGGSSDFILPSDDDGQEDSSVTISTVTDITNALELYVHLKGEPKYIKFAALAAVTLAAATVTIVRTLTVKQNRQDALWTLSTIFFCGMFLVFYSVFAFIITMYLNQVRFIQRLTSSICGDRNSGIAWVRAHNLSHLRAWEAVRRLAVLEITNPDSVLNSLFTPSMFLSSLACLIIAAYIVLRLLFEMVEVGPFILTLLVLFVLLLGFMVLVTGVANYAQSHLKLHTSIIAQKTYEIAKLIDEKYSDIERGLLVDTGADTNTEVSYMSESEFTTRSSFGGGNSGRQRRNTMGANWDQEQFGLGGDDFDDMEEQLRNTMMRNSSLADPETARAQLEMLFQERKFARARKPQQQQQQQQQQQPASPSQRREEGSHNRGGVSAHHHGSGIHMPHYLQPASNAVAVGFGAVDQKMVATTIKSAAQPVAAVQHQHTASYSSRPHPSDLRYDLVEDIAGENYDGYDNSQGYNSSGVGSGLRDGSSRHHLNDRRAEVDTDGVEKLSISALESCHASLLSLCNYFVANQPRPLILGMQLQNVRYAIVFVLLISGNLMFLALMLAFKGGKCKSE